MSDVIGSTDIGDAPEDFVQPYPQIDRDVVITGDLSPDTNDISDNYAFLAPSSGFATFTLSGLTGDLDLAFFGAGQQFLDGSFNAGTANDVVRIELVRGQLYYLDVQNYLGANSGYRLTLDFAAVPQLTGSTGADTLSGSANSEDLTGLGGNDLLLGGSGYDMAVYRDPAAGFVLGESGGQLVVRDTVPGDHDEGLDRLDSIEAIRFSDRTWRIEAPPTAGAPLLIRATIADEALQLGGGGTLAVDAGGGIDTAIFAGASRDYRFELQDGTLVVRDLLLSDGDDGTRLLSNAEILRFANRDLVITGGEFRVNTTATQTQVASCVAGLAGGGYTVAWTQITDGATELVYQVFSADGVKLGGELEVASAPGTLDGLPSITGLAAGGFAMSWTREVNGVSDVVIARFDNAGTLLGAPVQADSLTGGAEGFTGITQLSDGRLVATWSRASLDEQDWVIRLRLFDASGIPSGSAIQLSTVSDGLSIAPSVVALEGGGFVVCWARLDAQFRSHSMAQVFNANGTSAGAAFEVAATSDPVNGILTGLDTYSPDSVAQYALFYGPRISALPDGGFAVLVQRLVGQTGTLELHRFDATGNASGSTSIVTGAVTCDLIVLGDGTLVATWAQAGDSTRVTETDIYQQRFDLQGVAKGPATRVNSTTTAVQLLPDSAALGGGGYVVTWTSEGQDLGDLGLYAQQYQQNGDVVRIEVRGTDGDDVLFYIGSEPMRALGFGGDDLYLVERAEDQTIESPGEGTDTVKSTRDWTLGANLENLELAGIAQSGTGNALANDLLGNASGNALAGGAGDDTLDGAAGQDTMLGGDGNDLYLVDDAGDVVTEPAVAGNGSPANAGSNIDTVESTVSYVLAANIENLILKQGSGALLGTGNDSSANQLTGNANNNVLLGLALNDTLTGGAGNDTLNGGSGDDAMVGGAGDDLYLVSSALESGLITELSGEGNDTVQASVGFTLSAYVENLALTGTGNLNGTGNALANSLVGNGDNNVLSGGTGKDSLEGSAGNDTLNGGVGSDLLSGGAGNDTYLVAAGDKIVEALNGGADTVRSAISWTLAANVETLVLWGTANTQGNGNALANTITGSPGANLLQGLSGNDTLRGGDGNDTLAGGAGIDALTGGAGADDFLFNTAAGAANADVVKDFRHGTDRIVLDNDIYSALLGTGALDPLRFAAGPGLTRAPDADVRLAYDTTTGILYYDSDGLGGTAAPLRIAQFTGTSGPPVLAAADFLIVD